MPDDIEAIVRDMVNGLWFIRSAEGYGELVVEIEVRPTASRGVHACRRKASSTSGRGSASSL